MKNIFDLSDLTKEDLQQLVNEAESQLNERIEDVFQTISRTCKSLRRLGFEVSGGFGHTEDEAMIRLSKHAPMTEDVKQLVKSIFLLFYAGSRMTYDESDISHRFSCPISKVEAFYWNSIDVY